MKKLLLLSIGCLLLTGCGANYSEHNTRSEEEVINYVETFIKNELNEDFEVKVKSKKNLEICTAHFDSCINYKTLKFAYDYVLTVDTGYLVSEVRFADSYKEDDIVMGEIIDITDLIDDINDYNAIADLDVIFGKYRDISYDLKIDDSGLTSIVAHTYSKNGESYASLTNDIVNYRISKDNDFYYDIYIFSNEEDFMKYNGGSLYFTPSYQNNIDFDFGFNNNFVNKSVESYRATVYRFSSNGCSGNAGCSTLYGLN